MSLFLRKTRFFWRLARVFWERQGKIIFLTTILTLALALAGKFLIAKLSRVSEKIGIVGKYGITELPEEILSLISSGLTEIGETGNPLPAIAEKWERDNEDKEYLFTIRDNLFWQDGSQIKSEDLLYNFSDVAVSRPDEKHIRFTLKEPFSPFPVVVSRPILKKGMIGNGNYRVGIIKKNGDVVQRLKLIPNNAQAPILDFRFYPTEKAARIGFKLGDVDILRDIDSPEELAAWPKIRIGKEIKIDRFVAVFLNNQDPALSEKSVRQALAYAIKNHWEEKAFGPISPKSWAYNPSVKPYNHNLENAKKLIAKATEKGVKIEEMNLGTTSALMEEAELIKKDWEELGIKIKINVLRNLDNNYQALLITEKIPTDPDQYTFWHSTQPTNISHYKSPRVDKLLEDGRKIGDQNERKKIYLEFQKTILEDVPAIFLFHPIAYTVNRK